MIQGSDEWLKARCGLVTASRISDVMAKTKTGESASRKNYRAQLVAERISGRPTESFTSAAMQWGTDNEPFARAAYELLRNVDVDEVGLVPHPEIVMSGASPDGLVGDDGLIEIKCPNTATHIDYAITGKAPSDYQYQMLWQMECTGRQWCDFASYDPRMPDGMKLFVTRIQRDEEKIAEIKIEVIKFLAEVEAQIAQLREIFK